VNPARALLVAVCVATTSGRAADEFFDRVESALSVSAADARVRFHLSGLLDLEGYEFQRPAPMLLQARGDSLLEPRLTVFLDGQIGPGLYVFAQARADRGFDPAQESVRPRLDEYALRWTPWKDGRLRLQAGKFATIVGNWAVRHGSWVNPFITAPLPYEYLTGLWDNEAVRSAPTLLQWAHVRPGLPAALTAVEKRLRIPLLWGPSYTIGAAAFGEVRRVQYAFEVKHAALSSRPTVWSNWDEFHDHPTVNGRLGYRPSAMWDFGVSASAGTYLHPVATRSLAPRHGRADYKQVMFGQDVSFAWRHLQLWSEVYVARFEVPMVADAKTVAYYVEAKYKLTPQFSAALRWNEQLFATIPERLRATAWGHDVWRIDVAPAYRFTPHTQLKLQYSLQHGDSGSRDFTRMAAAQATVRF